MLSAVRRSANRATTRSLSRSLATSSRHNAPANAQTAVAQPPSVANSHLLRTDRTEALWTPGLKWRDEEQIGVGFPKDGGRNCELQETDLREVEEGGRPTEKLK